MTSVTKHLVGILIGSLMFGVCVGMYSVASNYADFSTRKVVVVAEPEVHDSIPIVKPLEPESTNETDGSMSGWYSFEVADSLADANLILLSTDIDTDENGIRKLRRMLVFLRGSKILAIVDISKRYGSRWTEGKLVSEQRR